MKIPVAKLIIPTLLTAVVGCSTESGEQDDDTNPGVIPTAEFRLLEEYDAGDPLNPRETAFDIPAGDGITATCTTEGWGASEVRDLTDVVGLDLSGTTLYPGALIQGADFENGRFVPITIPRAPGTIYMTGLVLDQGASYTAQDIPMRGSEVNQAVKNLITDYGVQGTEANFSFREETTHSYENMLFELGIDARFGSVDMEADLSIETTNVRNYTFGKFTQVFYDIVYEDPELATSVFRDGANFTDPEGQLNENNPPLYVSKVSYGRMVFFVAESTHDSKEVGAALDVAVKGGLGSGTVESGLTYEEVLARTNVYYYVVGGAAGLALAPIDTASPAEMFTAVKSFIANPKAADFSAENPGSPIAYSLKYLKDRRPARMSYNVSYDKKNCEFDRVEAPPAPEPLPPALAIDFSGLVGKVDVYINGVKKGWTVREADTMNLNSFLKSGNNDIELIFNRDAAGCVYHSVTWSIRNRSTPLAHRTIRQEPTVWCPWTNYHMRFTVNKDTGTYDYDSYVEYGT